MGKMIKIGMAELDVCLPPDAITTLGLGSCVGVVLYDPGKKISGMVHVMLPDSTKIKNNENIAKFADTGIEELLRRVLALGATRRSLVAKIAGGATMFTFQGSNSLAGQVEKRNSTAAKKKLKELNIPILAEDIGANYGRTVTFYPETGEFHIRAVGKPETVI